MKCDFNPFLVTIVAAQCLPYGKQRMCTQVQPTLILLAAEGKPIRPIKVKFLSFRLLGEVGMLQVQVASCPYTAACTFSIPFPPGYLKLQILI